MSNLKVRGAVVYRLASAIKFAAFGFLALTTAIFVWASFSNYFFEKFGPAVASVMGVVAIIVMYFLIDKGLDKLVEFLADEKINPGAPSSDENPKARKAFIRIALFMALIRLLATGTTSIWGSYEIADYITAAPDHTQAIGQMEDENKSLEQARNSLQQQLQQARNSERNRVKQAKQQGATLIVGALAQHASDDVRQGLRSGKRWYMTTPKLKKIRTAYQKAVSDSTALVQAESGKVGVIEAELLALNTSGFKTTQEIKNTLARAEESKVRAYEGRKSRRTNFLIIADVLSVLFGLLAVWVRSTFRAAVGVHSINEEKSIEGILWAAIVRVWNLFLIWLEKLLGVDLDGNGAIGMVSGTQGATAKQAKRSTETIGATAETTRRKIGYFGKSETSETPVSNKPDAVSEILETIDLNEVAKRLERARGKFRMYRYRVSNTPETIFINGEQKPNPPYLTAKNGLARAQQEITELESMLA